MEHKNDDVQVNILRGYSLLRKRLIEKIFLKRIGNDKRFSASIAELCLHHKIDDAYNGAYERNQALKSRAEMMQAWADYCYSLEK